MKIKVVPYDKSWPERFDRERTAIIDTLKSTLEHVHHIGSTAVEGLASKPIIDILLEVRSLEELDRATPQLESLGYEAKGEFGIPGRRYFRKGGSRRTHQIHAFKTGDAHVLRHMAFRDYLRAHPEVMREYGRLKTKLAADCDNDIDKYCDGKDAFMKHYEAEAIKWKKGA